MAENARVRQWEPPGPLDLIATVGHHRRGSGDPAMRHAPDGTVWRTSLTPDGPGTLAISLQGTQVTGRSWGPGADWMLDRLPALLGADDTPDLLEPVDPVVERLIRRAHGFRIGRTERVWEALVPAILEQKVVGAEAWRAWHHLLREYGEPAPGPVAESMRVPPPPRVWREIPNWEWHRAGAEPVRMRTIRAATTIDTERHADRLTVLRGVGPWTEAETRWRALGDPDAVPVGDFHIPSVVGHVLIGERVDDARMLELLEPYAGQRGRVVRMCVRYGPWPQRLGHRMSVRDHRHI